MPATTPLRRTFLKKLLLLLPAGSFLVSSTSAKPSHDYPVVEESEPTDPLMDKLNNIDALASECYDRLQDNSPLFKNIAEAKGQVTRLNNQLDICKQQAGSPDDLKAILDDLKAIKELVKIHS